MTRLKSKAEALAETAERRATARAPVLSTGEVGDLRTEARAALGAIGAVDRRRRAGRRRRRGASRRRRTSARRVFVAIVRRRRASCAASSGKRIDVEIRGKRMRVKLDDLRRAGARRGRRQTSAAAMPPTRPRGRSPAASTSPAAPPPSSSLIGATVDDAHRSRREVPGHGAARRRAPAARRARSRHRPAARRAADVLPQHPLVATVAPAPDNEGGDGATIVELKD